MRILILANHYNTLRIFRRELIKSLSNAGHEIYISIPPCDDENKGILESYGTQVLFTDFDRRGMNPIKDLRLLREYKHLIRKTKPDKVITYTIKCNIYGGFACRNANIPHYANITGLGSTFQNESLTKKLVSYLYKFSLRHSKRVFFENIGNCDTLVSLGCVKNDQCVVLPGAGVDLNEFSPVPYPSSNAPIRFLFVGRIMKEKGVDEYFAAIKRIKTEYPDTEFHFIGWYEDNYENTVKHLIHENLIEFHGFQSDVKPFIEKAHCIVHPSWHEGMSNTILEASSMCRPIITTNIHGCKEGIIENISGFLVSPKNEDELYSAMKKFVELSYEQRKAMGQSGHSHMKKCFDKQVVVNMTLKELF